MTTPHLNPLAITASRLFARGYNSYVIAGILHIPEAEVCSLLRQERAYRLSGKIRDNRLGAKQHFRAVLGDLLKIRREEPLHAR